MDSIFFVALEQQQLEDKRLSISREEQNCRLLAALEDAGVENAASLASSSALITNSLLRNGGGGSGTGSIEELNRITAPSTAEEHSTPPPSFNNIRIRCKNSQSVDMSIGSIGSMDRVNIYGRKLF